MKCFTTIALFVCISIVRAEPPVPQNQYLPPNQQAQQPSSNYLPPTQAHQTLSNNYLPPQRAQAPQNTYGTPAVTSASYPKQQVAGSYAGGNNGYGAGGYNNRDEDNYGPAKYEFKYDVQDYESGNDFGHMESRDGDLAVGRYYVLLPDGRKQIVEYEADQNGYRPTIRYEQVGNGNGNGNGAGAGGRGGNYNNGGGYDSNDQSKFSGYQ